ncbi:MAG: ECF transporter S component [Clostridia bacterium]|nr:ECF transporter S component [Oscillospiraceae bacterium]MBQ7034010.1 ECF transporter S component [Clostridia bacterium]
MKTKKLTTLALLCAIAYAVMYVSKLFPPVVLFLQYDPKDVIIALGGFIYGPLSALAISAVVSLLELVTVSDTGFIGLVMNIISSCTFACTASILYKYRRTLSGAVIGLVSGCFLTTVAMLLWNYFITPIYMHLPRETVAALLLPAFLPFNLIKGGMNAAIMLLIYKPVVSALRKAGLIPPSNSTDRRMSLPVTIVAVLVLLCLAGAILILK